MIDTCIILADSPGALVEVCGISILERLLRTLQRCEIKRAIVLSGTAEVIAREVARPSWARSQINTSVCEREPGTVTIKQIVDVWPKSLPLLMVVRGDTVFDIRLLRLLTRQTKSAVLIDGPPEMETLCGAAIVDYQRAITSTGPLEETLLREVATQHVAAINVDALPLYSPEIRREIRPYWFLAPAPSEKTSAERLLVRSAQKGMPDLPAWAHAPIENFLIARLCKTSITPGQLTFFCNAIAWIATIFFATGRIGWALALALIVGVVDGLDGKQARVKVETTNHGKLEHWFDAFFEWSWWTALAYHLQQSGQLPGAFRYLFLLLAAEGFDAILKAGVRFKTGRSIDELGTFERLVRLVGSRRNVFVWILTIAFLLGALANGFVAMSWLAVATGVVHLPSALWAFLGLRGAYLVPPNTASAASEMPDNRFGRLNALR